MGISKNRRVDLGPKLVLVNLFEPRSVRTVIWDGHILANTHSKKILANKQTNKRKPKGGEKNKTVR